MVFEKVLGAWESDSKSSGNKSSGSSAKLRFIGRDDLKIKIKGEMKDL